MRLNSNIPKTFSIKVTSKDGKSGYIRFRSYIDGDGKIRYSTSTVGNIKDASKYINFDNVKKTWKEIKGIERFTEIYVIDDKTMKSYSIRKNEKK